MALKMRLGLTVLLGLAACALSFAAEAQTPQTPQPPRYPPLPITRTVRLYVLDCGTIVSNRPENFGLTREEVFNPNFSDPCFLVIHPKGMLLFDTGLSDKLVGRPLYETMVGYEAQVKFKSLRGELADIGVTPEAITYLALSHSHWDHVGNANDYAGSIWLARKAEYDFMFRPGVNADALKNYDALARAPHIRYIDGDYDVFGDGTVVLLSTPGHTPGHQSLYVKLAKTGGVVVSGDLYHYTQERALGRIPEREKTTGTAASRHKVEDFLARTHSQLWIGHIIDWYRDARKSPAWYE
jgi:glyoxylase-like metal-dependent hydrolase (beta-lactamase superfamily II)